MAVPLGLLAGAPGPPTSQEVRVFRAASAEELTDIAHTGELRAHPDGKHYEGKLFAASAVDAAAFGRDFVMRYSESPIFTLAVDLAGNTDFLFPTWADARRVFAVDREDMAALNAAAVRVVALDWNEWRLH